MTRRSFFLSSLAALPVTIRTPQEAGPAADPWPQSELIEPAALVKLLASGDKQPHIICVAFPFLYRAKHIPHAQFAGPADKPEGIANLRAVVETLEKEAPLVIYCGCCPMDKCPNVRPAWRALKELAFQHVRVLNLPTNFHTDWTAKGYPVES